MPPRPEPRPEPLAVELVNTLWADRSSQHDRLAEPATARAWIRSVGAALPLTRAEIDRLDGWPAAPAGDGPDLPGLRDLRDAVRRLAGELTGDDRPVAASFAALPLDRAVQVVNAAAAGCAHHPVLEWPQGGRATSGVRLEGAAGARVLAALAASAIALLAGAPGEPELHACRAPGCVLFFTREHTRREWCSVGCGNRARAARHLARHGPTARRGQE